MRKIPEHDPELPETVSGFDEACYTRDITHPDGLRRRTAFIRSTDLRQRMLCLKYWEDVTEAFHAGPKPATPPAGPKKRRAGEVVARVEG